MSESLTVRLSRDLADALRDEARQSGVPKGEIVRQALSARLQQTSAGSTIARYAGVMRGPSDLSTNKTYRRAWRKKTRR